MTIRELIEAARNALDNAAAEQPTIVRAITAEKKDGYFLGEARGYLNVALRQLDEEEPFHGLLTRLDGAPVTSADI